MTVTAATTIDEAIERLDALCGPPRSRDGVACFARLYAAVTRGVRDAVHGRVFADEPFLERLDLVFAGFFFDTVAAYESDPASAPRAWVPLFEARARRGIDPLQFALAGMNAHINRDLPLALVRTCQELGIALDEGSPEHADFVAMNRLLAATEAGVKREFLTGPLPLLDRLLRRFGRVDDVVAMWNVERARDAAWANAQALWALRGDAHRSSEFAAALDRMVGFASRGLLRPAPGVLRRIWQRLGKLS